MERGNHRVVARLDVARTITWNAYPWYINKSPTASQLDAGVMPLRRLLELLPDVSVVMLMGRRAAGDRSRPHCSDASIEVVGEGCQRGPAVAGEDGTVHEGEAGDVQFGEAADGGSRGGTQRP
jgi:hypothetical protein